MIDYFPHISSSRNNTKISNIRMKYGLRGYGIYFAIIEKFFESRQKRLLYDIDAIYFDLRENKKIIESIINEFELFTFSKDKKYFFSVEYNESLKRVAEISEKRREAARQRWERQAENKEKAEAENKEEEKAEAKAEAKDKELPADTSSNQDERPAEQADNTAETKQIVSKEDYRQMLEYLYFERMIKAPGVELQRFLNHYDSTGWVNSKGQKIKNKFSLLKNWDTKDALKFPSNMADFMLMLSLCRDKLKDAGVDYHDIFLIGGVEEDNLDIRISCSEKFRIFFENNLDYYKDIICNYKAERDIIYIVPKNKT